MIFFNKFVFTKIYNISKTTQQINFFLTFHISYKNFFLISHLINTLKNFAESFKNKNLYNDKKI